MESHETKQSKQERVSSQVDKPKDNEQTKTDWTEREAEQVSAQGKSPRDDEQNTFTQYEKDVAAKYNAKPRLIRAIMENTCKALLQDEESDREINIDRIIQLVDEAKEQDELEKVTTGIQKLDYYLNQTSSEYQVAYFVLLDIGLRQHEIAAKVKDFLWNEIKVFDEEPGSSVELCGKEGVPEAAAEIEWWLALWRNRINPDQHHTRSESVHANNC